MATALSPIQTQILGATILELLNGELSDETIAAVDSLKREDIPTPLNNLVGMIHGMSTMPELRQSIVGMLLDEIRSASTELLEEKYWELPDPRSSAWDRMYLLLQDILQGSDPDVDLRENIQVGILPKREQMPGWAVQLIDHAEDSTASGKRLTLELLDVLENIIQKRRAELTK